MKATYTIVIGLVIILFMGSAMAQDSASPDQNAVVLQELVVTATRLEEAISSVPANVSLVTETDIVNSAATNVAELLRQETGVNVTDITGNRRNYTVDLRGFGETAALNTLVLVDGRRTNQADLSGVDWTQIPLDRVQRIEIIRGSRASALYGDNAAGGVINIITKKGKQVEYGGEVQTGSFDTYKASAYASGTINTLSYAFSGSYFDTGGYRDNSENQVKDFGADLGYTANDMLTFNFSAGYHEDTAGLPGALKDSDFEAGASRTDSINPNDYADYEDYYVKADPEINFMTNSIVRMDVSYRERNFVSYSNFSGGYFVGDTEINTLTINPQVIIEEPLFGFTNSLNIGMDYINVTEDITNTSEYFGSLTTGVFDLEKENYGYFIHDELSLTPNLSISGGFRYDTADYTFGMKNEVVDPDSTDFDESLFTAGINYRLNSMSNFYISYSESYRYPVLDEIFNFFSNNIDSSIAPQSSSDIEAGFRLALDSGIAVGFNLFYIETEDEIFYNPDFYMNMNMDGDTLRKGVEVTFEQQVGWGKYGVDYSFTEATIDGGLYDDAEIPNVPAHQAGFNLLVDYWKPFSVAINGKYVGERVFISDWANTFGDHEDYFVLNAKAKYAWKNATAFVSINNLFNTEYEEYGVLGGYPIERAYYPSPETNFMVGVSMAY